MKKQAAIQKAIRILINENRKSNPTMIAQVKKDMDSPFRVLVSCLLSLRTRDEITYPVASALLKKAPTARRLAEMPLKDIEKTIRSINYYKTKAWRIKEISRQIAYEHNGKVPSAIDELLKFKGVGRKTANIVVTYGFGKDGIAVDTHVHRISNRLGWVKTKNADKTELELRRIVPKKYWQWINELLVDHGRNICTPISPKCSQCPLEKICPKIGVESQR